MNKNVIDEIVRTARGDGKPIEADVAGERITDMRIVDDALRISLGERTLIIRDDGQSCCEERYMTADGDDLSAYVGSVFYGAWTRSGPKEHTGPMENHDIEFLVVLTSNGEAVFSAHNEHNGFYGVFRVRAHVEDR